MLALDRSGRRPRGLLPGLPTATCSQIWFAMLTGQLAVAAGEPIEWLVIIMLSLMSIRIGICSVIHDTLPLGLLLGPSRSVLGNWSAWPVALHSWAPSGHRMCTCFLDRRRRLVRIARSHVYVVIPSGSSSSSLRRRVLVASQELWYLDFGFLP